MINTAHHRPLPLASKMQGLPLPFSLVATMLAMAGIHIAQRVMSAEMDCALLSQVWAILEYKALTPQGTDPTTDLRGCNFLGLLHLLLLHEHDPSNAQAIFR